MFGSIIFIVLKNKMIVNENEGHVRKRAKSVTRAEEIKTITDKRRKSQPDKP